MVLLLEGIRIAKIRASYIIAGQIFIGLYNKSTGKLRLFGANNAIY